MVKSPRYLRQLSCSAVTLPRHPPLSCSALRMPHLLLAGTLRDLVLMLPLLGVLFFTDVRAGTALDNTWHVIGSCVCIMLQKVFLALLNEQSCQSQSKQILNLSQTASNRDFSANHKLTALQAQALPDGKHVWYLLF